MARTVSAVGGREGLVRTRCWLGWWTCLLLTVPAAFGFADFEGGLAGWSAGLRATSEPVHGGQGAARWRLDEASVVQTAAVPRDWTMSAGLEFWAHPAGPEGSQVAVVATSENPGTAGADYYYCYVPLGWTGWRRVRLPWRAFRPSRSPLGWEHVESLAFASAGYDGCRALPGASVVIDDLALYQLGPDERGLLGDFEYDTSAWLGAIRDPTVAIEGAASGRWEDLATTPCLRCASVPPDWSGWDNLELALHSAQRNQQELKLLVYSDDPRTEGIDGYCAKLSVYWEGWQHLKFGLRDDFQAIRQPLGWQAVSQLVIAGSGWGLQPQPDTVLHLDNIRLTRSPWNPYIVVSDMEEPPQRWPWLGLVQDEAQAHSAGSAGKWEDLAATPFVRITKLPHDWSGVAAVSFWCYAATQQEATLKLLVYSNDPATPLTDCYAVQFKVNWRGWRQLTFRLAQFQKNHQPIGWRQVDALLLAADGWGLRAPSGVSLWIDDLQLIRVPPPPAGSPGQTTRQSGGKP